MESLGELLAATVMLQGCHSEEGSSEKITDADYSSGNGELCPGTTHTSLADTILLLQLCWGKQLYIKNNK